MKWNVKYCRCARFTLIFTVQNKFFKNSTGNSGSRHKAEETILSNIHWLFVRLLLLFQPPCYLWLAWISTAVLCGSTNKQNKRKPLKMISLMALSKSLLIWKSKDFNLRNQTFCYAMFSLRVLICASASLLVKMMCVYAIYIILVLERNVNYYTWTCFILENMLRILHVILFPRVPENMQFHTNSHIFTVCVCCLYTIVFWFCPSLIKIYIFSLGISHCQPLIFARQNCELYIFLNYHPFHCNWKFFKWLFLVKYF